MRVLGNTELLEQVQQQIRRFRPHKLDSLKNCQLMDRVDTKFVLPVHKIPALLERLRTLCSVLDIADQRISSYENNYYDTKHRHFYRAHHDGKLNRYKVRSRTYAAHGQTFLEVKYKNNKSRTIKRRVPAVLAKLSDLSHYRVFLNKVGINSPSELTLVQHCNYQRLAFASLDKTERLTIDLELSYRDTEGADLSLADLAIVELKQNRLNRFSDLYRVVSRFGYRPSNFSKYCIGVCLLEPGRVKANRFKSALLAINKLRQAHRQDVYSERVK